MLCYCHGWPSCLRSKDPRYHQERPPCRISFVIMLPNQSWQWFNCWCLKSPSSVVNKIFSYVLYTLPHLRPVVMVFKGQEWSFLYIHKAYSTMELSSVTHEGFWALQKHSLNLEQVFNVSWGGRFCPWDFILCLWGVASAMFPKIWIWKETDGFYYWNP